MLEAETPELPITKAIKKVATPFKELLSAQNKLSSGGFAKVVPNQALFIKAWGDLKTKLTCV